MRKGENYAKSRNCYGQRLRHESHEQGSRYAGKTGVEYEMTIISAHREPDVFFEYAKSAEEKDFKVIIAGAGMAAHLPGMCAAIFPMPVIGIPMSGKNLEGVDALYSIVQMPPGIPVATVAITGESMQRFLRQEFLQHLIRSCLED